MNKTEKKSPEKKMSLKDKFLENPAENYMKAGIPVLILTAIGSFFSFRMIYKSAQEDKKIFGPYREKLKAEKKAARKAKWDAFFHKGEKNVNGKK